MNQELKDNLIKWAEKRGDIDLMIIFGSRTKGRERPDSDLDLGIWRSFKWSVDFHRKCVEQITDFMPTWENMLDQRRKRFLSKRKEATISK